MPDPLQKKSVSGLKNLKERKNKKLYKFKGGVING